MRKKNLDYKNMKRTLSNNKSTTQKKTCNKLLKQNTKRDKHWMKQDARIFFFEFENAWSEGDVEDTKFWKTQPKTLNQNLCKAYTKPQIKSPQNFSKVSNQNQCKLQKHKTLELKERKQMHMQMK
jgi:hypothetical protein